MDAESSFPSSRIETGPSSEFISKKLGTKRAKSTTPKLPPLKKRKAAAISSYSDVADQDTEECRTTHAQADDDGIPYSSKPKKPRKKKGEAPEEKRLKRFRAKPPVSYNERLERALGQRMFLLDRKRRTSQDRTHEEETFDIAGTTGNIYQVKIKKVPSCTCPDAKKGNQCKHIIYVLVNALKARSPLVYQLAFLTSELQALFAAAPPPPESTEAITETDTGCQRKPIEGDCPVCVMEFEPGENLVWCKGACGQNIHRHCFEQWAKIKPGQVRCVFCRSPWKVDKVDVTQVRKEGRVGENGYVNVASALGLSGQRDTSSYHQPWASRQRWGHH